MFIETSWYFDCEQILLQQRCIVELFGEPFLYEKDDCFISQRAQG